jgi:RNA polymerase sigma factor (sigma-70 family)
MALEDPDLALVRALQAGEDQAMSILMQRHRRGLFRFIFRHITNEADAIDLTQEVFIRAYFNVGRFRPTARFVTWLYHIALNVCRDYARSPAYRHSSQRIPSDLLFETSAEQKSLASNRAGPDRQAQQREEVRALEKVIGELPLDLKSPLILTALEGYSHIETAEMLGISAKAVEMKLYRARKLLLKKMKNIGF